MSGSVDDLLAGDWPDQPPWAIREAVAVIASRVQNSTNAPTAEQVLSACNVLRKNAYFDSVELLSSKFLERGHNAPGIRSLRIQSLIELNALDLAEFELRECLESARSAGEAGAFGLWAAEFEGQLARVHKQRYVLEKSEADLQRSIALYQGRFEHNGSYWHGINLVALSHVAHIAWPRSEWVSALPDKEAVARRILLSLRAAGHDRQSVDAEWVFATASEASLSLGLDDQAELWLHRLLTLPHRGLFAIQSYQRQLREIWGANAYAELPTCADKLARIISENLDRRFDKRSFSPAELSSLAGDEVALEKNFGGDGFFSVESVRKMLKSCQSIGCVTNKGGIRLGTGFLVAANELKAEWGSDLVFVTNSHVLSGTVPGSVGISDARVTFDLDNETSDSPTFYRVDRILFSSPPGPHGVVLDVTRQLDVTIAVISGLPEKEALPIADDLPVVTADTRAYVIGHPRGAEIQVSLHDSHVLGIDWNQRLVHYRTPTEPGSSGSPVFNHAWELIALHHAGSPRMPKFDPNPPPPYYEANEGITLVAIRKAISDAD